MDEIQKALNLAQSGQPAVLTFPEGKFVVLSWDKYCEMKKELISEKDREYLDYMGE